VTTVAIEERVLVLAPTGRDASAAAAILGKGGIATEVCSDLRELLGKLGDEAGALLVTEEALVPAETLRLLDVLAHQPRWSDLPLVVLTSGGETTLASLRMLRMLGETNVTLLERPVRPITLVKAVEMALRGRRHQYEVRDHLAALERARVDAEAANAAKDTFLAMLGHELRNPLSAVRNAVVTASLDDSRRAHALEIACRQADQLSRLIDDLLDVARITHDRIALRSERVHLTKILERAVESTRAATEAWSRRLTVVADPKPIYVVADPARLEQVFANLLSNAVKYTEPGGRIDLAVARHDDEAIIRIRDTGIGIAPELLPRIWDLFTQADRALDRAPGGLGIGLTVVRRIVELHGGRIEATSEGLGKGTEFVVALPALPPVPSVEEARPGGPADAISHHTADVLVLEDDPDVAEGLVMILELRGHHVCVAHDGVEALEAARANVPDLMLVDIGLPGMDGYEVARRVRRDPQLKDIVLVALTGYGRERDKHDAMVAGFEHHLVKPVDPDVLHGLVARVVKDHSPRAPRATSR
jgi:signal transduction histidine kinase/ActR/RegA family two-component response regulator